MVADWHDWKHLDRPTAWQKLRPRYATYLTSYPAYPSSVMQAGTRSTLISSASKMTWTATIAGAFVRREDHSKITSASYLIVDQGTACAALTPPGAEAKIMPDPEFTLAPGTNNRMQDFA